MPWPEEWRQERSLCNKLIKWLWIFILENAKPGFPRRRGTLWHCAKPHNAGCAVCLPSFGEYSFERTKPLGKYHNIIIITVKLKRRPDNVWYWGATKAIPWAWGMTERVRENFAINILSGLLILGCNESHSLGLRRVRENFAINLLSGLWIY